MKKSFLFIAFVSASILGFTGAKAQNVSKLTYTVDFVDYGEIEYGGPSERVWKFKNEGKENLIIKDAKGSCGCTVPEYPKDPILPGKEGVIKIKYDTKRPGPIAKTVTVTTNEPDGTNTHVIKVKGNVKAAPENNGVPVKENNGAPVGK